MALRKPNRGGLRPLFFSEGSAALLGTSGGFGGLKVLFWGLEVGHVGGSSLFFVGGGTPEKEWARILLPPTKRKPEQKETPMCQRGPRKVVVFLVV